MKGELRSQQCALALLTVDRAMRLLADARKSEDAEAAVARSPRRGRAGHCRTT
jgi:hypothetical protein